MNQLISMFMILISVSIFNFSSAAETNEASVDDKPNVLFIAIDERCRRRSAGEIADFSIKNMAPDERKTQTGNRVILDTDR